MYLVNSNIKNDLSFLPMAGNCSESTWKTLTLERANNIELDEFQQRAVELILMKENWTKDDYVSFKESIHKLECKDLQYCKNSVLKILQMDSKSIIEELYNFAMIQDFYPFSKRVKNKNKTGYSIETEKIKEIDSFRLMLEITRKIKSFTTKLVSDILKEEDPYIFADLLIDILNNQDEQSKEQLLNSFDNNFKYLEDFTIFQDMFLEYRKAFFKNMVSSLATIVGYANNRTKRKTDTNIYDYVKSKVINKES